MKKRLLVGIVAGGLMAAMLPGVASAGTDQDQATGSGKIEFESGEAAKFNLEARIGPGGQVKGNVNFRDVTWFDPYGENAAASIDCLIVDGNVAVMSGPWKKGAEPFGPSYPQALIWVEDNGQGEGAAPDRGVATGIPAGSSCADFVDFGGEAQDLLSGNVNVNDAD